MLWHGACSVVFFVVFLVHTCYGASEYFNSKTLQSKSDQNIDNYHFQYYTDYGISREEKGELQNKANNEQVLAVVGSYEYSLGDKFYKVTYQADEKGYRAKVTSGSRVFAIPTATLVSLSGGGLG